MNDLPGYLIVSDRAGWNKGPHRLAYSEANVKNIVSGLISRYGEGIEIKVLTLPDYTDVTARFLFPEVNQDAAPF